MNKAVKFAGVGMCVMGIGTTAFADVNVTVQDTYYVDVVYTGNTAFKRATIRILDESKEYPLYLGESKNVVYSEENGYTVNFDEIKLSSRLLDGTYKVKVGAGTVFEEESFEFVNTPAKIQALQRLKDAQNKTDFKTYFNEDYMFLGIDVDRYVALGDLKAKFCEALFDGLVFDDADVALENLEEQQAVLVQGMNRQYEILSLMTAKENLVDVVDNLQYVTLDKTYYDILSDKAKLVEIYSGYNIDESEEISLQEIEDKFDGASLCATIATCDFKTSEGALYYYEDKGVISEANKYYYNLLSELKKSEVFEEIKKQQITDYTLICNAFETVSKSIYDSLQVPRPSTRPSGGGGGGGGMSVKYPSEEDAENDDNPKEEDKTDTAKPEKKTFPDIGSVSWAKEAIEELATSGSISGDENGNFNPDNKITREEFLKIVVMAFEKYDSKATTDFVDVEKDKWYYPYVASGVKAGIVAGVSQECFGIHTNITRQDAAVILRRLYDKNTQGTEVSFADYDMISDYAKEAVRDLAAIGAISGMGDGKFCPKNDITRAEAAVLIYRLKSLMD